MSLKALSANCYRDVNLILYLYWLHYSHSETEIIVFVILNFIGLLVLSSLPLLVIIRLEIKTMESTRIEGERESAPKLYNPVLPT